MKLLEVHSWLWLVLFTVLHMIQSTNECLSEDGDYDFNLSFGNNFITAKPGCAKIPCAYSAPMRTHPGRLVWFRGSPEFPLDPQELKRVHNLFRPMLSTSDECSIILWDFNPHERIEVYGLMLEWGTNETHIFEERVTVAYSDLCFDGEPKVTWKGLKSKNPRKIKTRRPYSERLMYTPVPEEHQAEVMCEVEFGKNLTTNASTTLTVYSHPQILNISACSLNLDQLTCVCVSQGVPLPDIHWSLQNSIDFNAIVTSDNHITVRSSFTMTVEDASSISPTLCVSKNPLGQANMTLPLINKVTDAQEDGEYKNNLKK
ncbi:hypothetical protein DNTS_007291 [Danionella cerebrum]|uniref:Ig-like domain-containing protein n=1 Tax=Danionella cerebrum TaxID=2873325 RepID=A0A553R311_9TELE|nr:hypothetical protein DNTS_007291 [Danionella translucida]